MPAHSIYVSQLQRVWGNASAQRYREDSLLVRAAMTVLILLRVLSLANLKYLFASDSRLRRNFSEFYVALSALILWGLLTQPQRVPRWRGFVAAYVVAEMVIYRLYFLLVKSRDDKWSAIRLRGSLVLAIVNMAEVVLGFGVMYQSFACIGMPGEGAVILTSSSAVYFSLVTLTTLGFGDLVPLDDPSRLLTASELVVGFVLLVFLIPVLISGLTEELHIKS